MGGGGGGGSKWAPDTPQNFFSIYSYILRSKYSNKAVIVLKQCVASFVRIFVYLISNKIMHM